MHSLAAYILPNVAGNARSLQSGVEGTCSSSAALVRLCQNFRAASKDPLPQPSLLALCRYAVSAGDLSRESARPLASIDSIEEADCRPALKRLDRLVESAAGGTLPLVWLERVEAADGMLTRLFWEPRSALLTSLIRSPLLSAAACMAARSDSVRTSALEVPPLRPDFPSAVPAGSHPPSESVRDDIALRSAKAEGADIASALLGSCAAAAASLFRLDALARAALSLLASGCEHHIRQPHFRSCTIRK